MPYASFWKRTAAYLVDGIIYGVATAIVGQIVGLILGLSFGIASAGQTEPPITAILASTLIAFAAQGACYVIYYVWAESSSWQATIGKKIFGLKVTDLNGQRISFWRSLGRNLGMIVSTIILCVGYLMCLWTNKKQCLHDQMADCLVLDTKPNEKQGCLVATIIAAIILAFVFIVGILAAIALPQYTRAVERSRAAEAIIFLKAAQTAQAGYTAAHGRPTADWRQLDANLPCTIQGDTTLCAAQSFVYKLAPQTVSAVRKNDERVLYTITMDAKGSFSCKAEDDWGHSLCAAIAR